MRLDSITERLQERVELTSSLRRLPDESVAELKAAGLFRVLQPSRWGGAELHPNTFFDTQRAIARACASTGWVYGVVSVHAWQLALFPLQAQEEVWGEHPDALISSSYAPTGRVTPAPGGYRLSGRWSFSSGCDHCQWVFLGGFAQSEGAGPDMRTFLVPRSDFRIDDNWHTFALRGTGSKDIVLDDVFVPEHRTHKFTDGFRCQSPGNEHNPAPLYRIPFGQIFVRSVSTTSLGITEAALDFYRAVTGTKVGASDGSKAAEDPLAQMTCARAATAVDRNLLVLHRNFNELMDATETGGVSVERRAAMRWDSSQAVEACVEAVDAMFTAAGGRALFTDSPMHRWFCDVHGARAHYANRPEGPGRNYGRVLLGNRTQDWFL